MEARALVRMVYEATNKAPFKNDLGLREQIQRAVVSVMSINQQTSKQKGFACHLISRGLRFPR
jgi:four helix bundle protein